MIGELLSTRRSKRHKFQDLPKSQKQNLENNQPLKPHSHQKSHPHSSQSKSKNNSKQQRSVSASGSASYKNNNQYFRHLNEVKQFDIRQETKRSRSGNNPKLTKKTRSMIRLPPKLQEKNLGELQKSKICRKSYSPNRNYSEGMKRTNNNTNTYNYSTQCIKTTKFTQSKDNTNSKHLKSTRGQKNIKKEVGEKKVKKAKSKQKLRKNSGSHQIINEIKNFNTLKRKEDEIFTKIDTAEKSKKKQKKISPLKKNQIPKKKTQQTTTKVKPTKQKQFSKKRKSMSKSKKNLHHFESVDQMLLRHEGYDTTRNETTGISNYMSGRDSFRKKIKTDRDSFNKPKKKQQTSSKEKEVIISSTNLKKLRNDAATKIQKVYKGYITRKWLGQYLRIIQAAVVVQKNWRGYRQRKKFQTMKEQQILRAEKQRAKIISRIDSIIFQGKDISNGQDSKMNIDKWKDILFEVMSEKTVNEALKSRIKHFLQHEGESARSSMASQRSQKSHNSEQKLQEEIMSERRYFEKRLHKKDELSHSGKKSAKYLQSPESFHIANENSFIEQQSPSRRSFTKQSYITSHLMSPQSLSISPKLKKSQSPERILSNLHEIQALQRQNIIFQANTQKQHLQQLFQHQKCSPRSFKTRQQEIELKMQQSLREFQKSIKGVIEKCKMSSLSIGIQQVKSCSQSVMMTPENSQVKEALVREELQNLSEDQVKSRLFDRMENDKSSVQNDMIMCQREKGLQLQNYQFQMQAPQISQQLPMTQSPTTYYQNFQTFNINALSSSKSINPQPQSHPQRQLHPTYTQIDTSCNFLDEYLLTMIEYLRNKNQGKVMMEVLQNVKTMRNLSPYVVLRNLSVVKEDNFVEQDGFSLPLYKYLEDDNEIIKQQYITDYNKYFKMMKSPNKFTNAIQGSSSLINQPLQHYKKLLIDSFNQALNMKRPSTYIFTDHSIESFNSKQVMQRQEYDLESEYDMYCATAMQEIFLWFSVRYGYRGEEDDEMGVEQIVLQNAQRLQQMMKMEVEKKWDEYYQRIETIAKISEELFEELIVMETITIARTIQLYFTKTSAH